MRADITKHRAIGITTGVSRVIPSAVVPERPVHELSASRAGVPVVVEIITGGHGAKLELQPRIGFIASQLVLGGIDMRGSRRERQHEPNVLTRNVKDFR